MDATDARRRSRRDGDMAVASEAKGAGLPSAELLPGVRLVRARGFDPGTAVGGKALTARERRRALALGS